MSELSIKFSVTDFQLAVTCGYQKPFLVTKTVVKVTEKLPKKLLN